MNITPPSRRAALRNLIIVLTIFVTVLIYAYGWTVTAIDLEKPQQASRQQNVSNSLRELLSPRIFVQDRELHSTTASFLIGCETSDAPQAVIPPDEGAEYVVVTPTCGSPGDVIRVEAFNFVPSAEARVRWIPVEGQTRPRNILETNRESIVVNSGGGFSGTIEVPRISGSSGQIHQIEFVAATPVGSVRFSPITHEVLRRMAETIFMALLATSLAIPIAFALSFFAAHNLMKPVRLPLGNLMVVVIMLPLGYWLGSTLLGILGEFSVELGRGKFTGAAASLPFFALLSVGTSRRLSSDSLKFSIPDLVALLCALAIGIAFVVAPWTRPVGIDFTGSDLITLSREADPNSVISLWAIPIAAVLGGLGALWGLVDTSNQKMPRWIVFAAGLVGLIYYLDVLLNNSSFFESFSLGAWIALLGCIGLIGQAFVHREESAGVSFLDEPIRAIAGQIVLAVGIIFVIGLIGGFGILGSEQFHILGDKIRDPSIINSILRLPMPSFITDNVLRWLVNALADGIYSFGTLIGILGGLVELFIVPLAGIVGAFSLSSIISNLTTQPLRRVAAITTINYGLAGALGAASGAIVMGATAYIATSTALFGLLPPFIGALFGSGIAALLYNRGVQMARGHRRPHPIDQTVRLVLSLAGGVAIFILVFNLLNINRAIIDGTLPPATRVRILGISLPEYVLLAGMVGLVLGAIGGALSGLRAPFLVGDVLYNVTRNILNALRSIEPLIMGLIFVVWVGIGPFAGVLALTLHSIASLGKLYSEQIETIDDGPIEALKSTGANQLQTIIYAVVPQIIPPYIAFTMYRWDINVRMSTIIGFVGGGGIGLLLNQQINLLRYRDAGVAVLAIAVVVSILDYASASIRERVM